MTSQDAVIRPRLGVKEAVKAARVYFDDIYRDEQLEGVLLEEVELSDNEHIWHVTFGYDTDRPTASGAGLSFTRPGFVREYKTIDINAEDGSLLAVKIRKV